MSLKTKNRFLSGLILSVALFLLQYCRSRAVKDYHDKDFHCHNGPGLRNAEDFLKYKKLGWEPYRLVIQEENKKIGKAKVVLAGNSLIHLFLPELLEKEFPGKSVANRGIGGDMTDTLLDRIEEDVLSLDPSVVVLEIGGNDFIQGKCLPLVQQTHIAIIQRIHQKNPNTRVILLAIPPTLVPDLNRIVPIYNLFLSDYARKTKNVDYMELWDEFRDPQSPVLREEFVRPGDPLHFNNRGYEVLGRKLRELLKWH